ncbi:hypothetical protein H6P81_005779 [Aristolochia fimbriata]|uniref:Uncharacterized protein n=1 Tax=Aristolochia fimbriata TaxID=158543 RepID=A0AAV7EXM0_ARIFI|nr:hypothetical protein H6P81_005779 [Aristolochia fimbriata]
MGTTKIEGKGCGGKSKGHREGSVDREGRRASAANSRMTTWRIRLRQTRTTSLLMSRGGGLLSLPPRFTQSFFDKQNDFWITVNSRIETPSSVQMEWFRGSVLEDERCTGRDLRNRGKSRLYCLSLKSVWHGSPIEGTSSTTRGSVRALLEYIAIYHGVKGAPVTYELNSLLSLYSFSPCDRDISLLRFLYREESRLAHSFTPLRQSANTISNLGAQGRLPMQKKTLFGFGISWTAKWKIRLFASILMVKLCEKMGLREVHVGSSSPSWNSVSCWTPFFDDGHN